MKHILLLYFLGCSSVVWTQVSDSTAEPARNYAMLWYEIGPNHYGTIESSAVFSTARNITFSLRTLRRRIPLNFNTVYSELELQYQTDPDRFDYRQRYYLFGVGYNCHPKRLRYLLRFGAEGGLVLINSKNEKIVGYYPPSGYIPTVPNNAVYRGTFFRAHTQFIPTRLLGVQVAFTGIYDRISPGAMLSFTFMVGGVKN